jgi:SagB-type dehydrogenase family enzyme
VPGTLSGDAGDAVAARLVRAGFLVVAGTEDDEPSLRQWGPHELWFHARSRWGGRASTDHIGPTRTQGIAVAASRREAPCAEPVALAVPAPVATEFMAVLEARRSVRVHDDTRPITLEQLATFLHRCARVRATMQHEGVGYTSRPYPSGGTAYELELYPVVRRVAGLAEGLYRYEPHDHVLERLALRDTGLLDALLSRAAATALVPTPPQVLIVVAARFGRMLSRYDDMGYATTLKNVGVLYQTMYLVATQMGLAPCALGNGDTVIFEQATGLDPTQESSVGEFMLGSLAPEGVR